MSCEQKVRWLSKVEDIPNAKMEELERSLLTGDGMGEKFKLQVLQTLKQMVRDEERSKVAREGAGI